MLMKGLPINVGALLRDNMVRFRNNKRWRFCYGSLITRFLRSLGVEEERYDLCPPRAPHLVSELVDVTAVKGSTATSGPVLSAADRQARDESWMGRMFGMAELQLRLGARPATAEELVTLEERYPLTDSAMHMCRLGPAFQEPLDDDEPTREAAGTDTEDETDDASTALMLVDAAAGDDEDDEA